MAGAELVHRLAVRGDGAGLVRVLRQVLRGVPQMRPRWKRGVDLVEGMVGEALGQEYVARHFPAENKARMVELVDNLLKAFEQSIDGLEWMTPATSSSRRTPNLSVSRRRSATRMSGRTIRRWSWPPVS